MKQYFIIPLIVLSVIACGEEEQKEIDKKVEVSSLEMQTTEKFGNLIPKDGLPEGYIWDLKEGPDFSIYYATSKKQENKIIMGLYAGLHPSAQITKKEKKSKLFGKEVYWQFGEEPGKTYYLETLVTYDPGVEYIPVKIHIWIMANSVEEYENYLKKLEGLKLKLENSQNDSLTH